MSLILHLRSWGCRANVEEAAFLTQLEALHLQWFSAEEEGRTEDATEHKIRKSREEGKVARSQDVSAAVVLIFASVALALLAPSILRSSLEMTDYFFRISTELDITRDEFIVPVFFYYFVRLTLPIAIVCFIAAVLGNLMQVGFLFTTKPIEPDPKKIAPDLVKFVKRSFLSMEALFNLVKSTGKVVIVAVMAALNIMSDINRILNLVNSSFIDGFQLISWIAFRILIQTSVIFLVLSLFDYLFQRKQHLESIKMTKQEVKEERKTYEGDPFVKSRLKQRMRELMQRTMIQNVPTADVVITNPTHFAVAMEYKRDSMQAPVVVAKGQDALAQRIRSVAGENGIPIIENKPLARALYAEVEVGDAIPEKFYQAVVTVLKEVYRLDRSKAAVWT